MIFLFVIFLFVNFVLFVNVVVIRDFGLHFAVARCESGS